MVESEHKLLCVPTRYLASLASRRLPSFRGFVIISRPFHAELSVESSTGHVNTDACILLIQLSFHHFQLVQRFWIAFPEVLATWGTLWLRAHLGTVSDARRKKLRSF